MATKPIPVTHKIATYSCDKSVMSAVKVLDYVYQMIGGVTGNRSAMAVDELLTTALKLQQEGCINIRADDGKLHLTQKMLDAWCQTDKITFNTTQEKILMALVAMFEPQIYEDMKYHGIDRAAYSREQEPNAPWRHVEHSVHMGSLGRVGWNDVVFDGGNTEEALFRLWFQRSAAAL